MYHGTTAAFDEFSDGYVSGDSRYGPGFYFTESPVVAGRYSDPKYDKGRMVQKEGGGQNIRPAYLDIKQPLKIDSTYTFDKLPMELQYELARYGEYKPGQKITGAQIYEDLWRGYGEQYWGVSSWEAKDAAQAVLMRSGFDGITNIGGTPGSEHRVWIAFDPAQIQSAFSGVR